MKIELLYQDEHIIAVNKPSGILTVRDRLAKEKNLYDTLKVKYPELMIIHRLDRDTSGVILFALSIEAHRAFNMLFEQHQIVKIYHAIVVGTPRIAEGIIENYIDENLQKPGTYRVSSRGKLALSFYKTLEVYKRNSLIGFDIRTGRTHQVRVHAEHIGTPLAYDTLYNSDSGIYVSRLKPKYQTKADEVERSIIQRLSLHAYSINFRHPMTQAEVYIEAPYPRDFAKAIEILRKYR